MFYRLLIIYVFITSSMFSQGWFDNNENWKEVLYEKSAPAVVIVGRMNNNQVTGFGSGFNIDKQGLIVTNYHVIEGAEGVVVKFKNGDAFEALHYTFVDKYKDFVILKIPGHNLPFANFGNSNDVKVGQEVVAIGNPEGAWHTMTSGIISQKVPDGSHQLFQTDVTIAPGSSGGPLFNSNNQIIGITSSGLKVGLDINYAIPSKYVQGAINSSDATTREPIGFDIIRKTYTKPKVTNNSNQNTSTSNTPTTAKVSKASSEDPGTFASIASCYCMYLLILGLLPRG
jgi:S1-C subfamily serine protease